MKAVVHVKYGSADEALQLRDIDKPVIADDDVLVRVRAASMHPDVWHVVAGLPYVLRLMGNGVRKPRRTVPGTDLAGVVESIGKNVTRFKIGDEVFGESAKFGWHNGGAFAEYAAVSQELLALKPNNITFEQAAAVPASGYIALSNLRGVSTPLTGRNVLINGAGGCVGTLAIQIAKSDGARVTAVDCAEKLPMLRSLGADRVIDYTKGDFLQNGERYDLVLDVASNLSSDGCKHALTATGDYVPIGHAHYGEARGRMGGRVVGSLPYFIGRLLRVLLDPAKRKNFEILSNGCLQRAPRIGKAHAHRRQNVFARRSFRSHAVYAGRACARQNHHHAVSCSYERAGDAGIPPKVNEVDVTSERASPRRRGVGGRPRKAETPARHECPLRRDSAPRWRAPGCA